PHLDTRPTLPTRRSSDLELGLKKLVKLRNQAAKTLGFANFHAMQLHLNEQNGGDVIKLFDRLDELTREPFKKAKAEIDVELARADRKSTRLNSSHGSKSM